MFIRTIVITLATFLACSATVLASEVVDEKEALKILNRSDVVSKFHKSAHGYAVFPTIGKGGFGIGGAHGTGGVYKGGARVGDVSMTQISFGFQVGGQTYRQVVYFQDRRAFDEFTSGSFEFSVQAEAIAITSSASAQAGTEGSSASANETQAEAAYYKGMIIFTMGKGGLMFQAALGGQKYDYTPAN
jgi:lipid-binding SYLF domain-containing protein